MKRDSKQIIAQLIKEGQFFRSFQLIHEGIYDSEDADWNYKDVPHLHHIHALVEAIPAIVEDDIITSINIQKILFMKFPLAVVNFDQGKNHQVYFTTLFFFTLVVDTRFESVNINTTRVTTEYNIGSSWLLIKLFFPIMRWILTRNYRDLMSGDIPMRCRRGQLRSWGYSFKKNRDKYSFLETMNIMPSNVNPPANLVSPPERTTYHIPDALPIGSQVFWGRSDHLGLRIVRDESGIKIFPRLCPHEGADLDKSECNDGLISCPWHGRKFKPIFDIPNGKMHALFSSIHFELEIIWPSLSIWSK